MPRYWVIKARPGKGPTRNDLQKMLKENREDTWRTKKAIPKSLEYGDVMFIWASSPQLELVGVASYIEPVFINKLEKGEYRQFLLQYQSGYTETGLTISQLRADVELVTEHTPSFLLPGAAGTIFSLTMRQGNRLMRLMLNEIDVVGRLPIGTDIDNESDQPDRAAYIVNRIVRDTKKSREVKALYNSECQVCGTRLYSSAGPYAEGAHIWPLGEPHGGSDSKNNILCLCPNHHVLLDRGAFGIRDNFELISLDGRLNVHAEHKIDSKNLEYHRSTIFST